MGNKTSHDTTLRYHYFNDSLSLSILFHFEYAPQIRSTILALYKLVCMYVCIVEHVSRLLMVVTCICICPVM